MLFTNIPKLSFLKYPFIYIILLSILNIIVAPLICSLSVLFLLVSNNFVTKGVLKLEISLFILNE